MKNFKKYIALIVIVTQFLWSINGYANPQGLALTTDAAITSNTGGTEVITQNVNKAVLSWDSFGIAAGETTQFKQPSSSSIALNRVTGSSPSDIYGSLIANGQVFLVNQNGILFAPGSSVNVGGLVASTLDISNSNFISGQYTDPVTGQVVKGYQFNGAGGSSGLPKFGSVENDGNININAPGGYAALLGSRAWNTGTITATLGTVALATGNEIAVNLDPSGSISAVVVQKGLDNIMSGPESGILNSRTLSADGGQVILTAKSLQGLFNNLVNNTGTIEANSVSNQGGVVVLSGDEAPVTNSGDISANKVIVHTKDADFTNYTTQTDGNIAAQESIKITANNGNVNLEGGSLSANSPTGGNINLNGNNVDIGAPVTASGDVNVTAQASITNSTGNGLVTGNNFNFTGGIGVEAGYTAGMTSDNKNLVINITNTPGASAYNIYTVDITTGKLQYVTTVAAGSGGSTQWVGPAFTSGPMGTYVVTVQGAGGVGTSSNRINTNVKTINGQTYGTGDIDLNQGTQAVALKNLTTATGSIDVKAGGSADVGTINAANGTGDVTLSAGTTITDKNGGLVTGNNFNFTGGIGVEAGYTAGMTSDNKNLVINITNTPGASAYNIYTVDITTGKLQYVTTVAAGSGGSTQWVGPAFTSGPMGTYVVTVQGAGGVGTSSNRINTNVKTINGQTYGTGDIDLNQGTQAVALKNLTTATGSIDVKAGGSADVGTINAANGTGDVTLSAGTTITDKNGGLVTGNNFNFTGGIGVEAGYTAGMTSDNKNLVINITNTPGASAYNIYTVDITTGKLQYVTTVAAGSGGSTQWVGPAFTSGPMGTYVVTVQGAGGVGTSSNRINTNVKTINGQTYGTGDIDLNQGTQAVALKNLTTATGSIDVKAGGSADVGTINAANGTGDVTLSAGTTITDKNGGLVTGNNFNFTGGIGVEAGYTAGMTSDNKNLVINITNTPGASAYNIYTVDITTGKLQYVTTVAAGSGGSTQWVGPAFTSGPMGTYVVTVQGAGGVGTSSNRINTNVKTINGQTYGTGDIDLNQGTQAVALKNLTTATGSIDVKAGGSADVGTINAANGTGDVTLSAGTTITDKNGGLVTGNNFNFTGGIGVEAGYTAGMTSDNKNLVINITNTPGASAYNIYTVDITTGKLQYVTTVAAGSGGSTQWVGPAFTSGPMGTYVVTVQGAGGVGTSSNRINTNVKTINGQTYGTGDIDLNQGTQAVALKNLTTATGSIDVKAGGSADVGTINAANGTGDVTLSAGTTITDKNGGLVTGNNFNFTGGIGVEAGYTAGMTSDNKNLVINITNTPGASAYNIYTVDITTGKLQYVTTVAAGSGGSTQWVGPAFTSGPMGTYVVTVQGAGGVGTSSNRINTNVKTINGQTYGTGDIDLNQGTQAVALKNLTTATGSIDVKAGGSADVGTINAANGTGDVTLSAGTTITDKNGGLVTGNNFNFTGGIGVEAGYTAGMTSDNKNLVINITNTPGASAYNIYTVDITTGKLQYVTTVAAGSGGSTQWVGPAFTSGPMGTYVVTVQGAGGVGTSSNRINTNVKTINGQTYGTGDIDLNQGTQAVALKNLTTATGSIDVKAGGSADVGTINAANGTGDVTLSAGTTITDKNGGLVTGNNFNFTGGIGVEAGYTAGMTSDNKNLVINITNTPGASAYNIYTVDITTGKLQYVTTVAAGSGGSTQWVGPAFTSGPMGTYVVTVQGAGGVGTSSNRINTNVKTINGQTYGTGDIDLNQGTQAVALKNLTTATGSINVTAGGPMSANNVTTGGGPTNSITLTTTSGDISVTSVNAVGDVILNSVNGSILGIGGGINVTSGGDTHLTAGNLIGSWNPYSPLNVKVGKDLYLAIGNQASSATGSVGPMGVSGTLGGTVGGSITPPPGTPNPVSLTNGIFIGNPPGYIFLGAKEIWPNYIPTLSGTPSGTPSGPNTINNLAAIQNANIVQQNQTVYYESLNSHLVRQVEVAAPVNIYMYHPLVDSDNFAVDHIQLEPEAYDYIDQNINLINPLAPEDQKKKKKIK